MNNITFEKGYIIPSSDFSKVEEIRQSLKNEILSKKEELSYLKCAILLKDLTYFTKFGFSLYDYIKQKYNIEIEFFKEKETILASELEEYIFYIFSELNEKIQKNRETFNQDILIDFDLSCRIHFYPQKENTLLLISTEQEEYLKIIEDHIDIESYFFDPSLDEPPFGITNLQWINRAKDWIEVIMKCGGTLIDWTPSAGGFNVELTENGMFVPNIDYVYKAMETLHTPELDKLINDALFIN